MLNVVFDMMGLAAQEKGYYQFPRFVVYPLSKHKEFNLGFWTRDDLSWYSSASWAIFRIGKQEIRDIAQALEANNHSLLESVSQRTKLGESILDRKSLAPRWQAYKESGGVYQESPGKWKILHKYPPFLLDGSCLMVESDLGNWSILDQKMKRGSLFDCQIEFAQRMDFSLIMVPECPTVWEGGHCSVPQQEVLEELTRRILGWKGEKIIVDLGGEMGVYPDGPRVDAERL